MADQKLLFELRKLNPGVSDKDLIGAVAEATNSDPSKVQQALSPSILQKDREISAIDKLRLANPGVDDEDLIDNVAIETNKPVSQVRKALGMSDTKETKGLGERLLGDASAVGQKAGDLLGLNKRMGSVFDTVPAEADYKDMSFSEQQAQVSRQDERDQRAAGIIKNRKPKVKTFDEMSRSERAAFMAAENEKNKGFFDTLGEVGADVLTPEGFDKVRGKLPDAIGAIKSGIFDTSEASEDFAARGVGVNIPDVVKNFAAGANEVVSAALFMQENVLGGRVILKAMGLDDPNTYPSQVFKREAMKLEASLSEGAKASIRPIINNDGSLVDIEDRGGIVMKSLRSVPFMMTVMATGGPLAKVAEKALPTAVQAISPLAKAFIDKQLPGLARYISSTIPFASASAFIESGMAGSDQVRRVMDAPERELLGNKDYLKARLAGASKEEARAAMAQAVAVDAAYQNAAAAFVGGMVTGGGVESMMARFAAGAKPKDILGAIRQQAAEAGETPLKFVAKAAGQGGVAEFAEEAFVSGQQKLIENDIERRYFGNRSIDPNEGIIGASLEGGLIGLTSGSALSGAFAAANTPEKADKATSAKLAEYAKASSVEEVIDIARRNLATSTTKENVDKFLNDRFEEQVLTQLESPELQEAAGRGEDITGKIWDSLGGENNMFGYTHDEFQQKLTDIAAKDPEAVVTDQPVTDQPVTDQPVTDQPVTDQPVTDQPVTDQPVDEAATADAFNAKMDEATAEEGPTVTTADGTPVTAFDPPPTQDTVDTTTVTPDTLPFATRENVTPAQVEARRGIATSLLENLTKRAGGRLLATNISRDLVVRGSSALIGQRVQSPSDLAVVSQVLRDPRFETLRLFFVKDGAIVDHRTFSSRMPTSSSFLLSARQEGTAAAAESFKKDIAAAMSDAQADGYYVVHNHPQGSPEPSQGDLNLTTWLGQNVPGFVDHVVINSNEFARISMQNGKAVPELIQMDFGATKLPPAGNHPLLGASLINADGDIDLGSIAKAATAFKNNDDIFIAYGVNGNGEISTIVELPAAFLNLPAGRQQAYFRAFVSRSGISAVAVSAPTKLYGRLRRYMGDSISFMINHQTGESIQNLETHPNEQFNKGKPAKVVTEREPVQRSAIEVEKEKAKAPSKSRDDITKAKQEAKAKKEARLKEIEKAKAKSRANRKERREAKTKAEEERAREELQKAIAQRIAENEAKEAAKLEALREKAREETKNIDPDNLPFEQRPNPTQGQKELSRGLARRLLDNLSHKVGGTTLGTLLSTEFLTTGSSTLIGKKITSADELAVAAQVLRNPVFESLRFFLMKDGVIIGHRTYTSRLPNAASFVTQLRGQSRAEAYSGFLEYLNDTIKQTGADGYYVMHNHPVGLAKASKGDIEFTEYISKKVPGMISHVIINSNEYSNLTVEDGEVKAELVSAVLGEQVTEGAKDHPLLGVVPAFGTIIRERIIAEIASEFKHQKDKLAVFSTGYHGEIIAMMEVPSQFLQLSPTRKYAYIRQFLTRTGGLYLGVAAPNTMYKSLVPFVGKPIKLLINIDTNEALAAELDPETDNKDLWPVRTRIRVSTEKGEQSFSASLKQLKEVTKPAAKAETKAETKTETKAAKKETPVKKEVANIKANKDAANLEKLDLLMDDLRGRVIGSNLYSQRTHKFLGRQGDLGIGSDTVESLVAIYKDNTDDVGLLINDKNGKIVAFLRVPTAFLSKSTQLVNSAMKDIYKLTGGKSVSVALHPSGSTIPMKVDVVVNANTGEVVGAKTKPAAKAEPFTLENLSRNAVAAAMRSDTGIFGDNKVFISHVWRQMERDGTTMGLTFDQFKQQLGLALNKGFVDLSRADLAPAMDQTDVRESETKYQNSEFHFVKLGGTDAKFKHPFSVEQVTSLERAIAKLAAKATTEVEKKKGIKRVNTADMAKIFPHKDGSLAKLENVDVLVNDKPTTGAAVAWDGDNIVLNTNGKTKDEISQLLEDISKKILTERKEALARLRKTEIPTGAKAANLTPEQQAKNQIAKSKALIDFYLKVKPLADLQNVAPSMQHLIPLSKRIQASKVKTMPDLTRTEQKRMDYQDYMFAWKILQGSNIVDFELDATTNVYQQENLGKALAANAIEDFHKELREGVIKYMKDNNLDPKVVADYAFYLHVPEANEQIQKLWNDPRALAAGVTDEEAEAGLKKIEANAGAKLAAIKEAGNQWRDVAKETDRMLVDSGRISKEKHAAMNAVYKLYVPLRGNQDDSRIGVRRKGHEKREDEFIFENIIQMREAAIIAIERNRLNGILANFIAKVRNDNIGTISRPTKIATIKKQTVYEVRSSGKDGAVLGIFEDRDDAALFMDKYDLITDGNAIIKPTKEERAVMMAKPKLAPNEVVYYDNGEAIRIQINNDSLKRGIIDGAEKVVEGLLIKLSAKSLRFLTKVYTSWNLEFSVVNAVRDMTGSPIYVLGEKGFFETLRILGNYPRALSTLLVKPNDSIVQQFRKYGGNIGAAYLTDLERVQSDLKSDIRGGVMYAPKKGLQALGKALNHLNGASENALRLAVMMEGIRKANALRESGGSDLQIETMLYDYAQLSKDLMNFNRKGLNSNNMNATFIFFNAGMQGNQVVAHAIMRSKHKKQVWSAISGAMIISMFASLAAMGAFEDDEEERVKKMMEYKSLDAYSKHRNLTVGDTKIPLAYGFSVFHSIAVAMAEMAMGLPMDKTAIELAESAWLNFVPISAPITTGSDGVEFTPAQSLPTLLGILMAPQVNQDTFGRAIVPKKYDQSVIDAKTMTNAMKDSPYEWAAMALNKASGGDENRPGAIDVSPNTLNFFARTFTGGTGSGILNMGTVVYLYYKGAGSTVETSELPFARKFKIPKDDVRKSRSRFFDVKDTMQKEISRFKRDVKDEKVTELADQLFSPEEMKEANRISKAAKALKEEAREINNDKSLTTLQRRIQTKELELQELQLYNDFLIDFQRKYGIKF